MSKFRTFVISRSTYPVLSEQEINTWLAKNPNIQIRGIKFIQSVYGMHLLAVSYEEEPNV